jgi:hypothetical protein
LGAMIPSASSLDAVNAIFIFNFLIQSLVL